MQPNLKGEKFCALRNTSSRKHTPNESYCQPLNGLDYIKAFVVIFVSLFKMFSDF